MNITYRKAKKKDRQAISDICYHTGYMGESLEGRNIFNDRRCFALIFCLYYPLFEPENCFVAVDEKNHTVGYVMGTLDSTAQKKNFTRHMHWRIILHLISVTWWRYPGAARELFRWLRAPELALPDGLYAGYPAHLHTNLLPEFQGRGIGSELMRLFINHVRASGARGLHLATSNHNVKAMAFYEKMGFICISDRASNFWSDVEDYHEVIFAMKLNAEPPKAGENRDL